MTARRAHPSLNVRVAKITTTTLQIASTRGSRAGSIIHGGINHVLRVITSSVSETTRRKWTLSTVSIPFSIRVTDMKTFATILFVAASSLAGAQTARPDTIYLVTVSYGDSVVLRWAPGSAHLWKVAARNGYRIERKKLGERDYRVVTNSPLKPYSLSEWKRRTDTTNVHVATAAQVMLGTVMMKPQEAVSFSQKLLASEEERNRLALALYCAEFSIQAGNGLAFRWVDRDIERDASYYYRVSVVPEPNPVTVVPGVAKQKVADTYKPTPVMDVVAEGRDGEIEIRWDKGDNDRKFSGYFVERSEDGKTFNALNEVPFKTIEDERLGTEHVYV